LKVLGGQVRSFRELHRFVFGEHNAYAASRHERKQEQAIDPAVLSTY